MIQAKGEYSWGLSTDGTVLWVIQHDGSPPIQTDSPGLIEDLNAIRLLEDGMRVAVNMDGRWQEILLKAHRVFAGMRSIPGYPTSMRAAAKALRTDAGPVVASLFNRQSDHV
jgi:hypothetical protein